MEAEEHASIQVREPKMSGTVNVDAGIDPRFGVVVVINGVEFFVHVRDGELQVMSPYGTLAVEPRASNVVAIKAGAL